MDAKDVMEAVKKLRESLGLIQGKFADRIGKSCPTVQRYENVAPPPLVVIAQLVELARSEGKEESATTLKRAIVESFDPLVIQLIREDAQRSTVPVARKSREGTKRYRVGWRNYLGRRHAAGK